MRHTRGTKSIIIPSRRFIKRYSSDKLIADLKKKTLSILSPINFIFSHLELFLRSNGYYNIITPARSSLLLLQCEKKGNNFS